MSQASTHLPNDGVSASESSAGDRGDLGMRIVADLATESWVNRRLGIGSWADRAVPHVDHTTPPRRAMVLAAAAFNANNRGDPQTGRTLALEALRDELPSNTSSPARPFITLAVTDLFAGRPDRGVELLGGEARRRARSRRRRPLRDGPAPDRCDLHRQRRWPQGLDRRPGGESRVRSKLTNPLAARERTHLACLVRLAKTTRGRARRVRREPRPHSRRGSRHRGGVGPRALGPDPR